ncbi:hydrogenase maturation nickel metallochaperone HypA [Paludibacterium yongneupense]|uniref:hydrogenase maturation nickel metallochaperone HypA n=1 Tax=Paludibacterium yongneupense TaxID=400061 RepID=UPI00040C2549|nr:hydrogenase maturation nickel metallochaperone HypA [Paludibacterium yongneupense]
MHETAIVSGLMRILEQRAAAHDISRIVAVTLKVGRLAAVEPAQLRACFEMFAEDTIADGAELRIDTVAVRARCKVCATEFEVERFRFACPACASGDVDVLSGRELYIESFEAAKDDPAASATAD